MTVTRKQRDEEMESVGELLHRQELVPRPSEPLAISPPSPQSSEEAIEWLQRNGAPQWQIVVLQLAQDKRHDLAPHALRLWIDKLSDHSDAVICEALKQGRWEYFPSVDGVLELIEQIQERRGQEAGNREWSQWKANMKRAQDEGLMATEEDYAEMRAKLRELFGDPSVKQVAKGAQ